MAKTQTKSAAKFKSPEPITTRPAERVAARNAERRAAAANRRRLRLAPPSRMVGAILLFATIGFGIAVYTTVVHYAGVSFLACLGGKSAAQSSCAQVQFSQWNNVAGIPVSVLGLAGYFTIFASLRMRGELGRGIGFGTALIGFVFSLYLTYREVFTLKEICEWCVGSAICMTILMVLTAIRFIRTPLPSASAAAGSAQPVI
jgi:uncharacterized membrane protein